MANAINKVKMKLDKLALRNVNHHYVNRDLYRMLYNEEMFMMAYETIRVNDGVGTLGSAKTGIDSSSMRTIRKIITQLRNNTFKARPCRRTYILKPNGKLRPLGLPDFEEKLVQQCVTRILECIYDSPHLATFVDESHGFRKGRSCHTALKQMKNFFNGTNYVIKADIKGFFDNVDHHILINLLRRRIKDERFIQLIWKFLRAGIMVENGKGKYRINGKPYSYEKTYKGTPQGGIISPILANIYLHEFDMFIENMKRILFHTVQRNPSYVKERTKYNTLKRRKGKAIINTDEHEELKILVKQSQNLMQDIDSVQTYDATTGKLTLNYVRYADDWMIGIKGNIQQTKTVFGLCQCFFTDVLNLNWNMSKSYLSRSYDKEHEFLGVNVHFVKPSEVRYKYGVYNGTKTKRRTVQKNSVWFNLPKDTILNRLKAKGYLRLKGKVLVSNHQGKVMNLDDYDIALHYQSIINGIKNYYRFVNNVKALNYIGYLLCESMMKTYAGKYKSSMSKMFKKFGKPPTIKRGDGKKAVTIRYSPRIKRDVNAFSIKKGNGFINWHTIFFQGMGDTRSYLKEERCSICSSTDRIQIHHVNHIKRRGEKYKGFMQVHGAINRKQIPVCHECHWKIHNGDYDGGNLKGLADQIMVNLGIIKYKEEDTNARKEQ